MESMVLKNDFVALVNAELETQGISRAELARRMGVDAPYVSQYLNGRNSPGPDVMERFFEALGKRPRLHLEPLPRRRVLAIFEPGQ